MQKIEILIEENGSGAVRLVEVVADAPVSSLVPALVEELQLPRTDLFGKKLVYMLRQTSGGRILPDHTTLAASGIVPRTRFALASYVIDGSVETLLHNTLEATQIDEEFYSATTMGDSRGLPAMEREHTSGHLPVVKKEQTKTRRAFLLLSGIMLGIGGSGLGYVAYHGWASGALDNVLREVTTNFAVQETALPQKPTTSATPDPKQPLQSIKAERIFVFTRHQQTVRVVCWSPDGMLLASGGDDGQVFIWSIKEGVKLRITHPAPVRSLAWSPDNQRLVTGANNQITFFNVKTKMLLMRSTRHHTGVVMSLAWARANAMQVVSGAIDRRAIIWDTTSYLPQTTFMRHTSSIDAVAWSSDGQVVASASLGGVVRVWSAASGLEIHGFYQDANVPLRAIAFAPIGMQLAVGGDDGILRIWNGLVCQQQGGGIDPLCIDIPERFQVSAKAIRTIAWSPDAHLIAVGTNDGAFSIWNPALSQKPLLRVSQQTNVYSLSWSPDGKHLVAATGNTVTLWRVI